MNSTEINRNSQQQHKFFTQHGFNLDWGTPHEITLSSGKKRIVQNYSFNNINEVTHATLAFFCQQNIDKLESMSYTFGDPTNPKHPGFYRISYYCDPVNDPVNAGGSDCHKELLTIQHDLIGIVQRLSNLVKA
jgi:hypothetical protein